VYMIPWTRGFLGETEMISENGQVSVSNTGVIKKVDDRTLLISELPLGRWTQPYKEFLKTLVESSTILKFTEHHTDDNVLFEIKMSLAGMQSMVAKKTSLEQQFRLKGSLSSNMNMFDQKGRMMKYETAVDVIKSFCDIRLKLYEDRKNRLMATLEYEAGLLESKARFVQMIVDGKIDLKQKKKQLIANLLELGFKRKSEFNAILNQFGPSSVDDEADADADDEDEASEDAIANESSDMAEFNYLSEMRLWSLTSEQVDLALDRQETKNKELKDLKGTTIKQMWENDLQALEEGLVVADKAWEAVHAKKPVTIGGGGATREPDLKSKRQKTLVGKADQYAAKIAALSAGGESSSSDGAKKKKKAVTMAAAASGAGRKPRATSPAIGAGVAAGSAELVVRPRKGRGRASSALSALHDARPMPTARRPGFRLLAVAAALLPLLGGRLGWGRRPLEGLGRPSAGLPLHAAPEAVGRPWAVDVARRPLVGAVAPSLAAGMLR